MNGITLSSFQALASSIGVAKGALLAFIQTPLGGLLAAVSGIATFAGLLDLFTLSSAEANANMDKSFSAYQNAQTDVENVNNELATTQSRIDELKSKGSLTFVEQSELNKLQEANDKLQLQSDLKEKEAQKAARQSAKDTAIAYKENYGKYNLSNEKINSWLKDFQSGNLNVDAVLPNEQNLPALFAGLQYYKDLQKQNPEYASSYSSTIDDITESIWSQVTSLEDYKSKLEEVKETGGQLTDDQKNTLNDINDTIEFVYNKLDPEKFKQLQFDKIINQTRFAGVKDELVNIAKETDYNEPIK